MKQLLIFLLVFMTSIGFAQSRFDSVEIKNGTNRQSIFTIAKLKI
ncbi:hypothetical protein [Winogradskyella sp.]|nr:hypothetical protein [Winogradskyella sp.]